jgi:hypothetical protein
MNELVASIFPDVCGKSHPTRLEHPSEQRHRIHPAEGHARRASAGDFCRAGSEVGGGEGIAEKSPPAGCVKNEEAWSQPEEPIEWITPDS